MHRNILFFVPYPRNVAPSQRFRVEHYESVLKRENIRYDLAGFMDIPTWRIIFQQGHYGLKLAGVIKGFLRRIRDVWMARSYDYIFIHREAAPIGPPIFEWFIAKVLQKKIVYDFDDAIWMANTSEANSSVNWLKAPWKVKYICKWAYIVACGNQYLENFAKSSGARTMLLPTCVDVQTKHKTIKQHSDQNVVVGWTGSHSTLSHIDHLVPLIKELQNEYEFTFLIIADKMPSLDLKCWEFIQWDEETEHEDLLRIDIGIMPLPHTPWNEGKCGFKLIQYLSCGIPAVADPVGVNSKIIEDGVNGFLCKTEREWKDGLIQLICDKSLRAQFGSAGRKKIVEEFSIQSQEHKFLSLFQ